MERVVGAAAETRRRARRTREHARWTAARARRERRRSRRLYERTRTWLPTLDQVAPLMSLADLEHVLAVPDARPRARLQLVPPLPDRS